MKRAITTLRIIDGTQCFETVGEVDGRYFRVLNPKERFFDDSGLDQDAIFKYEKRLIARVIRLIADENQTGN